MVVWVERWVYGHHATYVEGKMGGRVHVRSASPGSGMEGSLGSHVPSKPEVQTDRSPSRSIRREEKMLGCLRPPKLCHFQSRLDIA